MVVIPPKCNKHYFLLLLLLKLMNKIKIYVKYKH